jgi:hypothetical protein
MEVEGADRTHWEEDAYEILIGIVIKRNNSEDLGVDGSATLK